MSKQIIYGSVAPISFGRDPATLADGTAYDYTVATAPYLYSVAINDLSLLAPYVANTDYLFFEP